MGGRGVVRSGREIYYVNNSTGGQGLARERRKANGIFPEAAVHRHILDRINAINDYLK